MLHAHAAQILLRRRKLLSGITVGKAVVRTNGSEDKEPKIRVADKSRPKLELFRSMAALPFARAQRKAALTETGYSRELRSQAFGICHN